MFALVIILSSYISNISRMDRAGKRYFVRCIGLFPLLKKGKTLIYSCMSF